MPNLIAANWKLNPTAHAEAVSLVENITIPNGVETVFLPPFVFLEELAEQFPHYSWGAQDFFFEDSGAYTGEVSLPMLKDVGADWVLVGHSERRGTFGETDEVVNKKLHAALDAGFHVILAVGEREREAGAGPVVASLTASTAGVGEDMLSRLVVAYEPVWAISSTPDAEPATPAHATEIITSLREIVDTRYLYGGSVTSENAAAFLAEEHIQGALVGGASLKADEFSAILQAAVIQ